MEKPMFYQGQRVVCVDRLPCTDGSLTNNPLIEGKSYYVTNPHFPTCYVNKVYIMVSGIWAAFNQRQFVPYDTDKELENEIHEALKGVKIENI